MKKNTTKILVAALALFMAIGIATGSTFAWFSLNSKVTVTGMHVTTKVSNSILIAPSTTDATAKAADSAFKTNYVATSNTLLEPVSTVNGVNYFYNASTNVVASGDAVTDSYIAYAEGDAFDTNYGVNDTPSTADAKGYVDYAFQIKATNTDPSNAYYVNFTAIDLLYNGAATTQKAFRVAIFVDDMGADGATPATAPSTTSLKTILKPTGAANFTADSAISAVDAAPTAINAAQNQPALIGTVAAGQTRFYKVVVRLWLEGEDNTCNNTTFATLTSDWALNLAIELQNATATLAVLGNTNSADTADLTSAVLADPAVTVVIDGITYNKLDTQLGGADLYTKDTTLYNDSRIYTVTDSKYLTDVTTQCTLPTTARP